MLDYEAVWPSLPFPQLLDSPEWELWKGIFEALLHLSPDAVHFTGIRYSSPL